MNSKTIELSQPVTINGVETRSLTLRSPKVRDMIAAEKAGTTNQEREVRLFANLCEVPPEAIAELELYDYRKLSEAYQGFLSSPRKRRKGSA